MMTAVQAEKKAKLKEREKERKKRAAERKAKAAEESQAAAEAEVSTAAAEAAALAARSAGYSGHLALFCCLPWTRCVQLPCAGIGFLCGCWRTLLLVEMLLVHSQRIGAVLALYGLTACA